ncbi:MAG: YHS domain-containing protein [Candidatus Nanoarchaeia archaeon]
MATTVFICCVCSKPVKQAKSGLVFKGKICYFCSDICREKFRANPAEFVK